MKMLMLALLLAVAAVSLTASTGAQPAATGPADGKGGRKLYHVVNFKFKDDATKESIKAVEDAFGALEGKIGGIRSLDWGTNVSSEGLDKGFTHCFVLTYANEADRDAYLKHAEHQAFVKLLKPILADALVIDFWSQEK